MKISNDTADIIKQKFLYFLTSGDDPVQYIKSTHQKCKKKKIMIVLHFYQFLQRQL